MWNKFLHNHVSCYQNTFFSPGGCCGNGFAWGEVCPNNTPFKEFKGQVTHSGGRFGIYFDNQYSRNVTFDSDGKLVNLDRSVCDATRPDGTDNGFLSVIDQSIEWHQLFIGQYSLGDFQYKNYTCVNSGTCMYWKVGKNFANDLTTQHIDEAYVFGDSTMSGSTGSTSMHGPAGKFAFNVRNLTFYGGSGFGLGAGQHCGIIGYNYGYYGAHCTVEYVLTTVDMTKTYNPKTFLFGISGGNRFLPTFTTYDLSLNTSDWPNDIPATGNAPYTLMAGYFPAFLDRPGCVATEGVGTGGEYLGETYNGGIICDKRTVIRRLNMVTTVQQVRQALEGVSEWPLFLS